MAYRNFPAGAWTLTSALMSYRWSPAISIFTSLWTMDMVYSAPGGPTAVDGTSASSAEARVPTMRGEPTSVFNDSVQFPAGSHGSVVLVMTPFSRGDPVILVSWIFGFLKTVATASLWKKFMKIFVFAEAG